MKKAQRKDFFREIRKSLNRWLSILAIVALGVAFFSGIRSSEPDMRLSVDKMADEANFMDIRVLSTMGLTGDDLDSIRQVQGITAAEGEYSADVLSIRGDTSLVLHVQSLTEEVNQITVTEGRLPQEPGECLIDSQLLITGDYEIGDQITVESGTEDPLSDTLARDTYTITGVGISPYHLNFDRGTSAIGNGSVDGFLVVLPEEFNLEVYTQIYAAADGLDPYITAGGAYQDAADRVREAVEEIADGRCEARLDEIKGEALEEIDEGQRELDEEREKAEAELSDAWQQILDGEAELSDGAEQIAENEQLLADSEREIEENEQALADGRTQLEEGERALADGKAQLEASEDQLASAQAEIAENEGLLASGREQLEAGRSQLEETRQLLEETRKQVSAGQAAYDENAKTLEEQSALTAAGRETLEAAKTELAGRKEQLEALRLTLEEMGIDPETVPEYTEGRTALEAYEQQLLAQEEELSAAEALLAQGKEALSAAAAELETGYEAIARMEAGISEGEAELSAREEELAAGESELAAAKAQVEAGLAELSAGKQELARREAELSAGLQEIEEGEAALADARAQLADGKAQLEEAKAELADGEAELADAKAEYEEGKAEAEAELADAQAEIDEARAEVDELELPQWHVLDRTSVQSYVEYDGDADKIHAIGQVFPVVFFLVAALVSLTTMTRMVEEKRTEIGTMKALGYGTLSIAAKYIGYALSATFIGSVLGFLIGEKAIPWVIITTYKILYVNLTAVEIPYNWGYAFWATGISILCTVGAALAACYKVTLSQPAQLMRPLAPMKGKKILLERVRFIWKRLSFSRKSTLRNLFRYKKRLFMTVFGIGACMALLLVGFGLRDSIYVVADKQYSELWLYEAMASLDEGADEEGLKELKDTLKEDGRIAESLSAHTAVMDGQANGVTKEVNVLVPEDMETFGDMFILRSRGNGKTYTLDDSGAVITEKLARMLDLSEGDEIVLKEGDGEGVSVPVAHIAENYVYHYVYISPALYGQAFGEDPEYNAEYLRLSEGADEKAVAETLLGIDAVTGITLVSDMNQTILDMLGSLDMVVWVLIVSAGLLAFVVLYNLNNINITERKRELATIKLLGFYDIELAVYVYRENVLLTLIGILAGILMGNVLHRFVIETVEVDMIMFGRSIHFISYLYGIGLTLLFAVFVNVTMFYKLRRIDMVESLKSVE